MENALNRTLINTTYSYEVNADELNGPVWLQRGPVSSVTSLTIYDDVNGSETSAVVDASNYQLVNSHLLVARNDGWDINRNHRAGTIVYVAGYGASADDVPDDIRMAMLELLSLRYERRGDEDRDYVISREDQIIADLYHYHLTT